MHQSILVIDDDADVREMLEVVLSEYGFEVLMAADALTGLRLAYQHRPCAIILDIVLPGMDGFEACRRLREMTETPILLLSGLETTPDAILKGLELGADEYMTKPFNMPELIGRLRVCLRRGNAGEEEPRRFYFPASSVILDCGRRELLIGDRPIQLSPNEYEVLLVLVRHAGHTLSQDALLSQVWGPERIGDDALIKQYIYQLRCKIEPDPEDPRYIHTVRGEGYYFLASQAA